MSSAAARSPSTTDPPVMPLNHRWTDPDDGRVWVMSDVAYAMGATSPFLVKWRKDKHPALGRPLEWIEDKVFIVARNGGDRFKEHVNLYLLADLEALLAYRERRSAPPEGCRPERHPVTVAEKLRVTAGAVYWAIRKKRAAAEEEPVIQSFRSRGRAGGNAPKREFNRCWNQKLVSPDEFVVKADPARISVADAAHETNTRQSLWYNWSKRKDKPGQHCPFTGKVLELTKQLWPTKNGRWLSFPQNTMSRTDYKVIRARLEEAKRGWFYRDTVRYLSPPAVVREYKVLRDRTKRPWQEGDPTLRDLGAKIRQHALKELGRAPDSRDGHYFTISEFHKLEHGACWAESELDRLFERDPLVPRPSAVPAPKTEAKRSPPPSTANGQQRAPTEQSQPVTTAPVEMQGPYAPRCLRIGNLSSSAFGRHQWRLLHCLWADGSPRPSKGLPAETVAGLVYGRRHYISGLDKLPGLMRDLNAKLDDEALPLQVESDGRGRQRIVRLILTTNPAAG